MSLDCGESCVGERVIRARVDPAMYDPRVLRNLLGLEERYHVSTRYFDYVQNDVQPYMRRMVATWMMQVCEEQRCEDDVFPLSMNYLDRYLSVREIHRTQLQSLGSACMLLASKAKETLPLTTEKLVIYTDNSVRQEELLEFELLLLMKLKWDILSVTPIDFVDQFLYYLGLPADDSEVARKHSNAFIHFCCIDHNFNAYTPSMMAAGCVSASVSEITGLPSHRLLARLQEITGVDSDILKACFEQVVAAIASSRRPSGSNPKCDEREGVKSQDSDRMPHPGNESNGHGADAAIECRHSHNTPTDVDMVF